MTLKDFLNNGDRFAAGCGARLVEIAPGTATAIMEVTPSHLNAGGVCQGGAIFTLAEDAFHVTITVSLTRKWLSRTRMAGVSPHLTGKPTPAVILSVSTPCNSSGHFLSMAN